MRSSRRLFFFAILLLAAVPAPALAGESAPLQLAPPAASSSGSHAEVVRTSSPKGTQVVLPSGGAADVLSDTLYSSDGRLTDLHPLHRDAAKEIAAPKTDAQTAPRTAAKAAPAQPKPGCSDPGTDEGRKGLWGVSCGIDADPAVPKPISGSGAQLGK